MNIESNNTPVHHYDPILTGNMDYFMQPGIVVEVDPEEAEALGAFEETALSEEEAWESNIDIEGEEATDGE